MDKADPRAELALKKNPISNDTWSNDALSERSLRPCLGKHLKSWLINNDHRNA
jgi:hypothetical protein